MAEKNEINQKAYPSSKLSFLSKHRPGLLLAASILVTIPVVGFIGREILRRRNTHLHAKTAG